MIERRLALGFVLLGGLACGVGCGGGRTSVPEEVIRQNILGTARLGQLQWSEADAAFRRALELRPQDPLLLTNRAIALNQAGRIDEAVSLLREALAAEPDYPFAHYNLGLTESRRGEFAAAAAHFSAVARFDPNDIFTQYYLGSALSRIDREEEAIAAFRAALAIDPDHVSSLYGLGRTLLQRGERDEGTRLLTRSQEVRERSGLDEAVGGQYGEQGPFALGIDYPAGALLPEEPLPVAFTPAMRAPHEPARTIAPGEGPPPWTRIPRAAGRADLLVREQGGLRRLASAGFADPIGRDVLVAEAADVDNDGIVELVAIAARDGAPTLTALRLDGTDLKSPVALAGLGTPASAAIDLAAVDRDHDGDLDVFFCWAGVAEEAEAGCGIGTNDGSGQFDVRPAEEHGFGLRGAAPGGIDVAFSDLDNDRDIDLIVAEPAALHTFSNQRDGTFVENSESIGLGKNAGSSSVTVADLDKDGRMDLVVTRPRVEVYLNRRDGFERAHGFDIPQQVFPAAVVFDFDNYGFLDLARSGSGAVALLRNGGGGHFAEQSLPSAGAASEGPLSATPLTALDFDGDGDLDLAVWEVGSGHASVALYTNEGGNANHWIKLESRGAGDNKYGIGAKVEVLAGALRQKFEIADPLPLHVGLGRRDAVQSARYLWPSGVLQDEIELQTGAAREITQLDRKGTSCPLLYAWRDGGWRFVSDFLGGSAIGYQHAPGVFSVPDTDEYVRIEGGLSPDREGALQLRLNNQLEEVIWFDQVELVVVDHPAGTDVFPNERLMPGPPFPQFSLFASHDIRPIAKAQEVESRRDVTERLRAGDRRFADGFALLRPKGYAELHTLEIDLGPFSHARRSVLLLDGWIDYADSTANVAAHQAGLTLVPPRLHLADGRGGWTEIEGVMGFPAGLPKTMALDLTGRFASPDHRLRIETSMRIYWDRARLLLGGERTELEVARLAPLSAQLRFGGFPKRVSPDGSKPFAYDPTEVEATGGFKAHVGLYTPFGDVTELLTRIDDRFVTTRNGDEIVLRFPSPGTPAKGRARTFLLYADGFGKDMDPNSAASDEVGPAPFHGMPGYPYPAGVAPEQGSFAQAARRVSPSPDGLPGAWPQALASR